MDEISYVERVMAVLGPLVTDERDLAMIKSDVPRFFKKGWTISETVAFLRLTEEVNPELSEEFALRRMAEITATVENRLAKG